MVRTLSELEDEDEDIQLNKEVLQEVKDSWIALREEI